MRIKIRTAKKDDPIYCEGITFSHIRSKRNHSFKIESLDDVRTSKDFKPKKNEEDINE